MGADELQVLGDDIWAVRAPLSIWGISISTQMTVIRLADNSLILISPIAINAALQQKISELGTVKAIISPNNFHHLFARDCAANFPNAGYYAPPGLNIRVKNSLESADLHALGDDFYLGEIASVRFCENHIADERVFFHPKSKSLIVTDLLMNFSGQLSFATKVFTTLMGLNNGLGVSRMQRSFINDWEQARESIRAILSWDFQQILIPHNSNLNDKAKHRAEQAFRPLL